MWGWPRELVHKLLLSAMISASKLCLFTLCKNRKFSREIFRCLSVRNDSSPVCPLVDILLNSSDTRKVRMQESERWCLWCAYLLRQSEGVFRVHTVAYWHKKMAKNLCSYSGAYHSPALLSLLHYLSNTHLPMKYWSSMTGLSNSRMTTSQKLLGVIMLVQCEENNTLHPTGGVTTRKFASKLMGKALDIQKNK